MCVGFFSFATFNTEWEKSIFSSVIFSEYFFCWLFYFLFHLGFYQLAPEITAFSDIGVYRKLHFARLFF
ncbi:hypothetical protein BG55_10815 [Erwinia mallotivora]|uniref:Uncharacterized protein n=1 Tax=Erwinia mallotivora TaxID=69222 RepID=A0A014PXV2_9GAMM|nr:hypothetical protein BG55_10815 [Erwinia mallotivora]